MLKTKQISVPGYEKVVMATDEASKLHAVIAVHSTALGPALGGIRMFLYASEKKALEDALKLAKAMTYKAAISDLNLGGGKAVVMGNPNWDKSRNLFLALGEFIHQLGGIYIAAEDSGIKTEDLDILSEKTSYVTGTTCLKNGSGDPSPATAWGILVGIQTCCQEVLGSSNLRNLTVAIQGIGQVGWALAKRLEAVGARLIVSDISEKRVKEAEKILKVKVVSPQEIHSVKADVFSPCALGGVLNSKTIGEIQAKIVAGGANNQFEDETKDSIRLSKRGILHAPDYVINAGGLIQLYVKEILKKEDITPWIKGIDKTLSKIFRLSKERKQPPLLIAHELAEEKIRK